MSDFRAEIKATLDTSQVEKQLKDLQDKEIKINANTGDSKKNIDNVNNSMKNVGKTASSVGNSLKKSLDIGGAAALTAKGMSLIHTTAKNATDAIKDFDDAVKDLRMATNESYESVSNMVKGYNQMGQALGSTTKEVSSAADAWLRQGHSIADTNTLIKDSMVLAKVANIESAEATEFLTSAMKGYGVEVENVSKIVDKLTSVDLVSATDAGGLAEAMSKVAVTADMAGVSMDKLLGYLAVVGETTQDPMSSIGQAFKTIFTRMSDIKAGKLELVDGNGTIETLSDVELTLRKVGIDLRKTVSEYNSYGDVLDALSSKWSTLNQDQQNALTKAFAGTRQGNYFRVLMENYDTASKYMQVAADSAGTAEQKFNAYLDSIEAKSKSLQAAFESLAFNTVSTDLVGGIVDASTEILKFLDTTNLLKGSLAGLAAAGAVKGFTLMSAGIKKATIQMNNFNTAIKMAKSGNLAADEFQKLTVLTQNLSQSQLKAVLSSKSLSDQQRIQILTSRGMSEAEAQATLTTMGLATAEGTATASTFTLSGAIKGLWATLMANPLILVVAGITSAISAYSTYKQHLEEARQASLQAGTAAKEEANNLSSLYSAYNQAKLTKDGLTDATDALLSALGLEQAEIDGLVEKYGSLDEAINKVTEDALKQDLSEMTAGYQAAVDELLEATKDGWFSDFDVIKFKDGDKTKTYESVLKDAGLIDSGSVFSKNGGTIDFGDNSTIDGVIKMYQRLIDTRQALDDAIADGKYTRDELTQSDLYKTISDRINSFSSEYEDVLDYINQINETAAQLQMMDLFENTEIPKTQSEFDALKDSMIKTAMESGEFVGSQEQIEDAVINVMSTMPELEQYVQDYSSSVTDSADASISAAETLSDSINTLKDSSTAIKESIDAVSSAVISQSTGKSIDYDTFNSDELADYQSALEYVNGTMQINAEKAKEIAKAKVEEQVATNNATKAQKQAKYLENAAQIDQLRKKIQENNYATGESEEIILAQIEALQSDNDAIKTTCSEIDLLNSTLYESIGAYQNWLNAQNAAQSGDMFDSAIDAFKKLDDTINDTESDSYGRIGNEDYKAALDFVIPDTVDRDDQKAVDTYMDNLSKYFTWDDNGNRNGLNIDRFCKEAVKAGLMVFDEAEESYQIAGEKTMEDFANGMNMALPFVQAIFGEMQEFGGEFDWADEADKTLGDLAVTATDAATALKGIKGNENLAIKIDVSDCETTEDALNILDATIAEMNTVKAKTNVDSSEVEYANQVIKYCIQQKQYLNEPAVMSVDTSLVQGKIGDAMQLLQDFQNAQNNVEMKAALGVDTTEAQGEVDSLVGQIQELSPKITAGLNIDTTSADTISASLAQLSPEVMVKMGVNEDAIIGYTPEDKDATTHYDVDTTKVDEYKEKNDDKEATVIYGVDHKAVDIYDPDNLTRTVTYKIKTVGSVTSGGGSLNGTAHTTGTAMAGGNWGTAAGGKTLVGEMGTEIVVSPQTGRWYTVGDYGAEFVDIPKGAIVFNHLQSKSLLENGYAIGRATALASGTAMVTGGISGVQAKKSTAGKNTTRTKKKSSKKSSSKSSSKSSEKDFEETFDWIEIAVNRVETAIKNLKATADNAFKSFTTRNNALNKEIKQITKEISLQEKAYKRYMQQANSVGLSSSWRQKVQNGSINISTIKDENLANKIKDYQTYYEKAIACRDAIAELKQTESELYNQRMELTQSRYNNKIDYYDTLIGNTESAISYAESRGGYGTKKQYSQMQSYTRAEIKNLVAERSALQSQLNSAVKKGTIKKYSEQWYEWQNQINSLNGEIYSASEKIADYAEQIANIPLDKLDKKLEKISSTIEVLDAQYEAAQSAASKNKILKSQNSQAKSEMNAYKTASSEATSYVNSLWNSSALKSARRTSANKGKSKGSKLSTSGLDRNSAAYQAVLNYNAALDAQAEATNNARKATYEYTVTLRENAKQMFDNIKEEYESKQSPTNALISYYNTALSYRDSMGYSQTSDGQKNIYKKLISNTENLLASQEKELNDLLNSYNKNKSTMSAADAREARSEIYQLREEILETKASIADLQSELNNIEVKKLEISLDNLQTKANELEDALSLKEAKGLSATAEDYVALINNSQKQIDNLKKQNELLKEQQEQYATNSEKYQELNEQIADNEAAIREAEKAQVEWNNAIADIPISKLEKALESVQAISDYEESLLDLKVASGEVVTEEDYQKQIQAQNDKLAQLQEERELIYGYYQKALESEDGTYAGKTADEWKKEYTELDTEINQVKIDIIELEEEIDNIDIKRLTNEMSDLEHEASKLQDTLDMKELNGEKVTASDYQALINNSQQQVSNLEEQNRLLEQQLSEVEEGSDKYYEIKGQIQDNEEAIAQCKKEQAEWNEEMKNLPVKELQAELEEIESQMGSIQNSLDIKETKGIKATEEDYRQLIAASKEEVANLEQQNRLLKQQQAECEVGSEKYNELQEQINANTNAIEQAEQQQAEWNVAIENLPLERLEDALDLLDAIDEKTKSEVELKVATGQDLTEADYQSQISDNNNQINNLENQRLEATMNYKKALASSDGVYGGKTADEWKAIINETDASINNLRIENEELKDSLRDDVYWRQFERMHDEAERTRDVLDGISDLIDDDMMFDSDGNLTQYGIDKIALLTKQYELARKEVRNYTNDIENLNKLYAEGQYTEEEYREKLSELQSGLLDAASDMKDYQDSIIDMYKERDQAELDALYEIIDKRREALDAKKSYYSFDKTIRGKTKDIQELQAQLAALEGITGAEAAAKRAKLQAELSDAQEDLDDTLKEHEFEIAQESLDAMKDTLQDAFDDRWDDIASDMDEVQKLMNDANNIVESSTAQINTSLNDLLNYYGINASATEIDTTSGVGYDNGSNNSSSGSISVSNSSSANNSSTTSGTDSGIASDISNAFSNVFGYTEMNIDTIKSILESIYNGTGTQLGAFESAFDSWNSETNYNIEDFKRLFSDTFNMTSMDMATIEEILAQIQNITPELIQESISATKDFYSELVKVGDRSIPALEKLTENQVGNFSMNIDKMFNVEDMDSGILDNPQKLNMLCETMYKYVDRRMAEELRRYGIKKKC